jgi:hypothetical protein
MRKYSGPVAWLGLTGYVVLYDVFALKSSRETLSSAFFRGLQHPIKRWPVALRWAILTGHLFHLIPRKLDPIHQLTGLIIRVG